MKNTALVAAIFGLVGAAQEVSPSASDWPEIRANRPTYSNPKAAKARAARKKAKRHSKRFARA